VVNGSVRRNFAAAFDLRTGQVTPWDPDFDDAVLCLVPRNDVILAAGAFATLSSSTSPKARRFFAACDAATGVATTANSVPRFDAFKGGPVEGILSTAARVFFGGNGAGFSANPPSDYDSSTSNLRRVTGLAALPLEPILPRITSVARQGSACRFSFEAQSGECYRVEYKNDLGDLAWQSLTNLTAGGLTALVVDALGDHARRFYRVTAGD